MFGNVAHPRVGVALVSTVPSEQQLPGRPADSESTPSTPRNFSSPQGRTLTGSPPRLPLLASAGLPPIPILPPGRRSVCACTAEEIARTTEPCISSLSVECATISGPATTQHADWPRGYRRETSGDGSNAPSPEKSSTLSATTSRPLRVYRNVPSRDNQVCDRISRVRSHR